MEKEINIFIWEKEFTIPIEYDCYKGETITEKQVEAVNTFIANPCWIRDSLNVVKSYCNDEAKRDNNVDIFSYVNPKYLFVKRNEQEPAVALMLDYKNDPEHGLALVFKMNGEVSVGSQDIIL